jgi:putative pyruvate formate lyase activating enzyme
MQQHPPSYLKLAASGALSERVRSTSKHLDSCDLCPHLCHTGRNAGKTGFCRAGHKAIISDFGPHFGEEAPLVGRYGSGTIFFAFCNLRCAFCQNYDLSQQGTGRETDTDELAEIMLELKAMGCHNINLVSPTHFVPQILAALELAAGQGLDLPLVYNTGGYESLETLRLLEDIVDIYMPDIKYARHEIAEKYSGIKNYPDIVKQAVQEMYRQVGNLKTDRNGIAYRGLLVRHLVLPGDLAGTAEIMGFLAETISPEAVVNIMEQYYPAYNSHKFPELNRRITGEEYRLALAAARKAGLTPARL